MQTILGAESRIRIVLVMYLYWQSKEQRQAVHIGQGESLWGPATVEFGGGGTGEAQFPPLLRRLMFEFSASLRLLRGSTLVCSQNLSVRFTKKFARAPKWLSDLWYVSWIRNNGKNQVMQWLSYKCSVIFCPDQIECTSGDPRILLQSSFLVDKREAIISVSH